MNQQIRLLAEQVEWRFADRLTGEFSEYDKRLLKFAELIVRECLGCCEQVINDPVPKSVDTWLNGGTQCMAKIKHHFGVE